MSVDARTDVRRWWGQHWIEVLERAGPSAARRVQRGHAIARRGVVDGLRIGPGEIVGSVAEDRVSPYQVRLSWPLPPDDAWDAAVRTLGSELRFTAALLDGQLPPDLADALADAGVRLLPELSDLELTCPCTERVPLCRHVAAVYVAAGVAVDRDPTLLLVLRGRSRDRLLGSVRTDRGPASLGGGPLPDLSLGLEAAHGDLDAVELHPAPVGDPASLFRHLGEPPGVDDDLPFVAIIERAAAGAWRLAAGEGSEAADQALLLAELRAQRTATASSLADALGRDPAAIRAELDRLFEAGTVMRTGSGGGARYRAAAT